MDVIRIILEFCITVSLDVSVCSTPPTFFDSVFCGFWLRKHDKVAMIGRIFTFYFQVLSTGCEIRDQL